MYLGVEDGDSNEVMKTMAYVKKEMYQSILSAITGKTHKEIRGDMVDASGEGIDTDDREQSQAVPMIKKQDIIGIEFPNS